MQHFDVVRFLQWPIDIRKRVYFHLNGSFTRLDPSSDTTDEDTHDTNGKRLLRISKRLYPVYQPYLEMFEYNSTLIHRWLQYSLWLRYDAVVIDCLRVNHHYEGDLLAPLDIICLDGSIRVGLFDKNSLLQICYSIDEFNSYIIDRAASMVEISSNIEYLRFNMDVLSPQLSLLTFEQLIRGRKLDLIRQIWFGEDESTLPNDDYLDSTFNADSSLLEEIESSSPSLSPSPQKPRRGRKRKQSSLDDSTTVIARRRRTKPTISKHIKNIIDRTKTMRNLQKVYCRNYKLFDAIINAHGIRERSHTSFNYLVRRRVLHLYLTRMKSLTTKDCPADLSKWDNLRTLSLVDISHINFNEITLPATCTSLTMKNIAQVVWWDFIPKFEDICSTNDNEVEYIDWCPHLLKTCRFENCNHKLNVWQKLTLKNPSPTVMYQCRREFWKLLPQLAYLEFQNIGNFMNTPLVFPESLYSNNRIKLFHCEHATKIIVI